MPVNFGLLGDIEAPKPLNLATDILSGIKVAQEQARAQQEAMRKEQELKLNQQKAVSQIALQTAQTKKATVETAYMPVMNQARLMEMQTRMARDQISMKETLGRINMQPIENATKQMDYIQKRNEYVGNISWAASQDQTGKFMDNWNNIYAPAYLRAGIKVPEKCTLDNIKIIKDTVNGFAIQSKQYSDLTKSAMNDKLSTGAEITIPGTGVKVSFSKSDGGVEQKFNEYETKEYSEEFKPDLRKRSEAAQTIINDTSRILYLINKNTDSHGVFVGNFSYLTKDEANELSMLYNNLVIERLATVPGASRGTKALLTALMASKPSLERKPMAAKNTVRSILESQMDVAELYNDFLPFAEAQGFHTTGTILSSWSAIKGAHPTFTKNGKIDPNTRGLWKVYDLRKLNEHIKNGTGIAAIDNETAFINGQEQSRKSYIKAFIKKNPGKTRLDALKNWIKITGEQ